MVKNEIAFEEWKHVQAVIARKSESCLKIRGWIYTLISAIIIAHITNKITWSEIEVVLISIFITTFFLILEGIQALEHWRAIKRSNEIEQALKENNKYDGPILSQEMIKCSSLQEIREVFILNSHGFRHFVMPYTIVYIIAIIVAFYG